MLSSIHLYIETKTTQKS